MHPRTVQFADLLASYSEPDERCAVALEFAELFIEEENPAEILALLGGVSANTTATFIARVNEAPTSEAEWARLLVVGSNLTTEEAARAKARWCECVSRVRKVIG